MRTIVGSSSGMSGSNSMTTQLSSSTSSTTDLLSTDTDPLMSASSYLSETPSAAILDHLSLKIELKSESDGTSRRQTDSTNVTASVAPRQHNNSSNNSSSGGESLCHSPSYQRSQNNYSLPPINGLTAGFKQQQQTTSSLSANHSPARKTLTVHTSNSSGASPLSGGSVSSKTPPAIQYSQRLQPAVEQVAKTLNVTAITTRERSVSASNFSTDTNSNGGDGVANLLTAVGEGLHSNTDVSMLNDPLIFYGHEKLNHTSPSSGTTDSAGSVPNTNNGTCSNRTRQTGATNNSSNINTSTSSSYTTLMPLQLTALPPISNVSDKFAGSPLRMFGSTPSSGSSNASQVNGATGGTLGTEPGDPTFEKLNSANLLLSNADSDGGTNIDSGNVIFVNDGAGHHHMSNGGENGYVISDHHQSAMSSAFSGLDVSSLLNLNSLDQLVNGDQLLCDFQSHDSQLQHIDNFSSSLPLHQQQQQQQQQHHQTLSELQPPPPPIQYYQQNPFSHLGNPHYQNQPFRLTVGAGNVFVPTSSNGNSYVQDSMRQLTTADGGGGIHVQVGNNESGLTNNVIMMGNTLDSSTFSLMDQPPSTSSGNSSQIFVSSHGDSGSRSLKSQHNGQSGSNIEPRFIKNLIPQQQQQQQQQQPLTFVTIQGQMPVGAIKITIPTQQQQQHLSQPPQYQQQFYQPGPGGFLQTAIINGESRLIAPSNMMLFTGPNGQTFLVNNSAAMPFQQQSSSTVVSSQQQQQQQQQSMHPEIANEVIVKSSMPLNGLEFLDADAGDYDDNDFADEPSIYEQKPIKSETGDGGKTSTPSCSKPHEKQSSGKTSLTNVINKLTSKVQQQQQKEQQQVANLAGTQSKAANETQSSSRAVVKRNSPTITIPTSTGPTNGAQTRVTVKRTPLNSGATATPSITNGNQAAGPSSLNGKPVVEVIPSNSALPVLAATTTTKGYIVRPVNATNSKIDHAAKVSASSAHRFTTLSTNPSANNNGGLCGSTTSATSPVRKYQPLPILSQQPAERITAVNGTISNSAIANGVISAKNLVTNAKPVPVVDTRNGVAPEGESFSSASSMLNCIADGEDGSTTDDDEDDDDDGRRSSSISNPEEDAEMEKVNTRDLSQRVSAELKRYSIPQAVFAQRVLCRSQGTLSDLLRNPKPWSKLKSGRETFRRMWRWLQEPEFQRMSNLRLAACKRKEIDHAPFGSSGTAPKTAAESSSRSSYTSGEEGDQQQTADEEEGDECEEEQTAATSATIVASSSGPPNISSAPPTASAAAASARLKQIVAEQSLSTNTDTTELGHHSGSKKPRLVFTELQKRTLLAVFKENRRPNKDMQLAIAQQLQLDITTVSNFFMNARRRSQDKWLDDNAAAATATSCPTPALPASSAAGAGKKVGVTETTVKTAAGNALNTAST